MKLYSFYTPSHEILKEEWFVASSKDNWEYVFEKHDQQCESGAYNSLGWIDCMKRKVDLIIRAIKENKNKIFVHSDVDIQFFAPIIPIIEGCMNGKDMVIQKESPSGRICPGFFAARGNDRNMNLWQQIRLGLGSQTKFNDQDLLNAILCKKSWLDRVKGVMSDRTGIRNRYSLKWDYLPESFLSVGSQNGKLWNPGDEIVIPEDIVLHHANWTIGIENKKRQLDYVHRVVNSKKCVTVVS